MLHAARSIRSSRRGAIRTSAVAAVVLASALTGCSNSAVSSSPDASKASSPTGSNATAPAGAPVVVGVVYTDDNPLGVSPEIRDAAVKAETYINSIGGLGGRPLHVVTCNGKNNPDNEVKCATEFVNDGALTVFGLDGIWGQNAVSILGRGGVLNQTFPISQPEFGADNAYPFHGATLTAGAAVAAYAAENKLSVTCAYPDVASLKAACVDFFQKPAEALGVNNIKLVAIPPTATDLAQYATKIASAGSDLVYTSASTPTNIGLIQNAQRLGYKAQWIIPASSVGPDLFNTLGQAAIGVGFSFDVKYWSDTNDPETKAFLNAVGLTPDKIKPHMVNVFSDLMTLKTLGDKIGGGQLTREGLKAAYDKIDGLKQFMGPELSVSTHIPGYPHALHTGAYLYKAVSPTSFEALGKGYYSIK